ncbi:MAG TPA: acylglycerol kinase family protein [Candidatus Saccharimonadales bacterium]|nr:acylglycerol kinase family protein [Candidatus Saccharimonadales bacterium]
MPGEPIPQFLSEYERFLVYSNPVSRHAGHLGRDLEQFHELAAEHHMAVEIKDTWAEHDRNVEEVGKDARPGDIIVIRGGDGTAGDILSALHELQRGLPALLVPRGNANDLAHMLYANNYFDEPKHILRQESVEDLYPWEVHFQADDGTESFHQAWTYFTLGSSALTACLYNRPQYRRSLWHKFPGGTWLRERATATHAYLANDRFVVEESGGKPIKLQDRVISSGNRMAKDFKLNVDLFSDEARLVDARNKWAGLLVIQGLLAGRVMGTTTSEKLQFRATGRPTLRAQIGGEDFAFQGTVDISTRRSDQAVPVFTATEDTVVSEQTRKA